MRPFSKKRQSERGRRKKLVQTLLDERLICEARIAGCYRVPTDIHEILTRGRGGDYLDEDNCLALCRNCHTFITVNPAWAKEHGFVVSWSVSIEADLLAAERARAEFVHGVVRDVFPREDYEF